MTSLSDREKGRRQERREILKLLRGMAKEWKNDAGGRGLILGRAIALIKERGR